MLHIEQIRCCRHPSQFITNFCANQSCMVGLCATCICEHTQHHVKTNTSPIYQNIKDTYVSTKQKLNQYSQTITEEKARVVRDKDIQNQLKEVIDKTKNDIKNLIFQAKEETLIFVEKCFDEIQASFQKELQNQILKTGYQYEERLTSIRDSLSKEQQQVSKNINQLNSLKFLQSIRSVNQNFLPEGNILIDKITQQLSLHEKFQPEMLYNRNVFLELGRIIRKMLVLSFTSPLLISQVRNQVHRFEAVSPTKKNHISPTHLYRTVQENCFPPQQGQRLIISQERMGRTSPDLLQRQSKMTAKTSTPKNSRFKSPNYPLFP